MDEFKEFVMSLLASRESLFGFDAAESSMENSEAHAWSGGCNHVLNLLEEKLSVDAS